MRIFPGIHSKQSVQTLRVFGGVLPVENSSPELLPSTLLVSWTWLILINVSIGIFHLQSLLSMPSACQHQMMNTLFTLFDPVHPEMNI